MSLWTRTGAMALAIGLVWSVQGEARAGVPECGGIRIEAGAQCQLKLGADCGASCTAGIYEKACATKGFEVCLPECDVDTDVVCTNDCSESCTSDCAEGIDVVCHDNCFPECAVECDSLCATADDTIQCRASCEATCDGECDHQCAVLPPNSSCYDHCMECCDGSCAASANMQCQMSCQSITWEQCEYELQASCEASCEFQGSLFCDGQFIIGGQPLYECVGALTELGLDIVKEVVDGGTLEDIEEIEEDIEEWGEGLDADADGGGLSMGCSCDAGGDDRPAALGAGLLLLGLLGLRRRRRS